MAFLLRGSNWPVEWPLVAIVDAALLYALGGRVAARPSRWRSASFYGGLATLVLAIDSPLDAYADSLFFVHMVQHVLLLMVAPPLILLGRPWPRMTRAFPLEVRRPLARTVLVGETLSLGRRAVRAISAPLPAFALFNGVLIAWHVPYLYDLTLRSTLVHDLEHAMFFATGLLFWAASGAGRRPAATQRHGPRRVRDGGDPRRLGARGRARVRVPSRSTAPMRLCRTGHSASRRSPTSRSRRGSCGFPPRSR